MGMLIGSLMNLKYIFPLSRHLGFDWILDRSRKNEGELSSQFKTWHPFMKHFKSLTSLFFWLRSKWRVKELVLSLLYVFDEERVLRQLLHGSYVACILGL